MGKKHISRLKFMSPNKNPNQYELPLPLSIVCYIIDATSKEKKEPYLYLPLMLVPQCSGYYWMCTAILDVDMCS